MLIETLISWAPLIEKGKKDKNEELSVLFSQFHELVKEVDHFISEFTSKPSNLFRRIIKFTDKCLNSNSIKEKFINYNNRIDNFRKDINTFSSYQSYKNTSRLESMSKVII